MLPKRINILLEVDTFDCSDENYCIEIYEEIEEQLKKTMSLILTYIDYDIMDLKELNMSTSHLDDDMIKEFIKMENIFNFLLNISPNKTFKMLNKEYIITSLSDFLSSLNDSEILYFWYSLPKNTKSLFNVNILLYIAYHRPDMIKYTNIPLKNIETF